MRPIHKTMIAAAALTSSLLAGALTLQVNAPTDREAQDKHAVLTARVLACRAPEKTSLTATAEGIVDGVRKTLVLNAIPLSTAGTYAFTRQWPRKGVWVIKMMVRNPAYGSYSTATLVPFFNDAPQWKSVKQFYRAPTEADVAELLSDHSNLASVSLH